MQQSKFEDLKNNLKSNYFEVNKYVDGREITYERELRRKLDRKDTIKMARKIAIGFDNIDLRKPVTDYQFKKAKRILKEFIDNTDYRYIPVRPSAKNRAAYAKLSDMPDYFKIYPVPVSGDLTRYEFQGDKIIERGPYIDYTTYFFPDQLEFAKHQKREIRRLIREIEKQEQFDFTKPGEKQLRIKTGKYHTRAKYDRDSVIDEISDWNTAYGVERVNSFVRGIVVATIHNQNRKVNKTVKKKRFRKPATKKKNK